MELRDKVKQAVNEKHQEASRFAAEPYEEGVYSLSGLVDYALEEIYNSGDYNPDKITKSEIVDLVDQLY